MPIALKNQGTVAADATGASTAPPSLPVTRQRNRGHAKPLPITLDLNQPGRIRVGHWLTLLQISHASFYSRLREGELPSPDGRDGKGKRPYWKTSTAKRVIDG